MSIITYEAMCYARLRHGKQLRKYTFDPYVVHLAEVAAIVQTVASEQKDVHPDTMIGVAWCHDLIEDTDTLAQELEEKFNKDFSFGVLLLSDLETGNRATRKQLARERLGSAPGWVQSIKLADLISNTPSIVKHDPNFAIVYVREVTAYLEVLTVGDNRLKDMLVNVLNESRKTPSY